MVNKTDEIITFTFTIESLFNEAGLITAYSAKSIVDKDGNNKVESHAITNDDKKAFNKCLEITVNELQSFIKKLLPSETITINGNSVDISIRNNDCYNNNILDIVDKTLFNILINGVLREWFTLTLLADLVKLYGEKYQQLYIKLNDELFQLKKKKIKETISTTINDY